MSSPVVLIVDDHASFRRVARRMLETAGFAVDEAANGTDAVAASRSGRYDLVLLDVRSLTPTTRSWCRSSRWTGWPSARSSPT